METASLRVLDLARKAKCSRGTVLNYEKNGIIKSVRDINGHRRFTLADAEKLKSILSARWPGKQNENVPNGRDL